MSDDPGRIDMEWLAQKYHHWKMVEEDAAIRLKQAKRSGEEPRFWADKREQARKKANLCALMAEGKERYDIRRV